MNKKVIFSFLILVIITISVVLLLNIIYLKNGLMICTYTSSNDIYKINTKYEIKFKNRIVSNLYTEEIIEASDEKMLNEYKTSLDLVYSKYSNLKYYDNSVTIKNNKLVSKTNINYQKLDISKFIALDKNNRKLLTNNKLELKKLKKTYTDSGARCTYK